VSAEPQDRPADYAEPAELQDRRAVHPDGVTASLETPDGALRIVISRRRASGSPGAMVFDLEGHIDFDTAPLLADALLRALDREPVVCCDLDRVVFFGATGANVLRDADRHGRSLGHRLVLRGVRGVARDVLRVADLESLVGA
jgi:anti-anti-sigma factor